jgi:polynucleotide 5'-hydroxyl-kinase GRC3/NOL9
VSATWAAALEAAAAARVTLVLGANDAGKTTLVTRLAGALADAGHTVGVVDADLGQSDVGPPTTVGLGRVRRPLERLADAELVALEFLGVTSPARCMRETAEATARLVRRALELGHDRVLVDTSGLVEGHFGRALKRLKIDRVGPDVLVALQRTDEVEPLLSVYAEAGRPMIVRLPAAPPARRSAACTMLTAPSSSSRSSWDRRRSRPRAMRAAICSVGLVSPRSTCDSIGAETPQRSAAARRHARQRALDAHLGGAVPVTLDLARIDARPAPAVRGLAVSEAEGALVGLDGGDGCTLGLGWVRAIDTANGRLTVQTRVAPDRIAAVAIGRERYRAA